MAFVSWAQTLINWKDAISSGQIERFLISSVENSREMRTSYQTLGSVAKFTEWLEMKASEESTGYSPGTIFISVGGSS